MSTSEALLITALGISVVFFGLLLCVLFIKLIGSIASRITWTGAHHGAHAPAAPTPAPAPAPAEAAPASAPETIPAEIQAVIATVLEIEQRLYTGRNYQRLTLRRNDA